MKIPLILSNLNFRVQHYGEGDKIPQHKYGIYSIEWPKERDRLINQAKAKKVENRPRLFSSKTEETKKYSATHQRREAQSATPQKYHEFEKRKVLKDKNDFRNISNLINRALPIKNAKQTYNNFGGVDILTTRRVTETGDINPPNDDAIVARGSSSMKSKVSNDRNDRNQYPAKASTHSAKNRPEGFSPTAGKNIGDVRNHANNYLVYFDSKPKRYVNDNSQSQFLDDVRRNDKLKMLKSTIKAETERLKGQQNELKRMSEMEKTQGDRLNEIKAIRQLLKKYKADEVENEQRRYLENTNQPKKLGRSY